MADAVSIINLDAKTGDYVEVKTVITPQEIGLTIQVGDAGSLTVVRIDQPENRQAIRRLADALYEAYRSARTG